MNELKNFNPMKLREKYSVKSLNKTNNYSSFWLDDGWDNTTSFFDEEVEKPGVDLIALASYRRAIANFVNIVTSKNIPVTFSATGDSYTDGEKVTISAKLDDIENVHIFDDCYAVGASLGHPPVASNGMITYMDDEIEHYKYWMSSAPTIFGNSGGAVYRWSGGRKQYEYIGIPSRISIQPMGFSADAITHMGYFIPIDRVYQLLEDNDYQFIYDDSISIDECKKARKAKQKPEDKDKDEDDE